MLTVEKAKQVWKDAQESLTQASAKLHLVKHEGALQQYEAEEAYEDALAECAVAKSLYDTLRNGTPQLEIRCLPRAG